MDVMSTIPALRRETPALWSLHHTLGYGLRKFQGRVGQAEPSLQHLASATSQDILGTIKKRTSQLAELKPPNAAWPNWRSRRLKGRPCQQSPSSDSVANEAEKELGSAPSVGASHEWPRRTLKPHLSDEFTLLNEEESTLSETDGDLCSSSGSNSMHDIKIVTLLGRASLVGQVDDRRPNEGSLNGKWLAGRRFWKLCTLPTQAQPVVDAIGPMKRWSRCLRIWSKTSSIS